MVLGRPLYLSKFYEEIEAIDGVDYVTIREFRSQTDTEDKEASKEKGELEKGKIVFEDCQIPVIPDDAKYNTGIQVVLERED